MSPSQIAVHTFTNQPWSIHECIENYARAEIGGISVWRETIADEDLKQVRKHLDDSGLAPVSLGSPRHARHDRQVGLSCLAGHDLTRKVAP